MFCRMPAPDALAPSRETGATGGLAGENGKGMPERRGKAYGRVGQHHRACIQCGKLYPGDHLLRGGPDVWGLGAAAGGGRERRRYAPDHPKLHGAGGHGPDPADSAAFQYGGRQGQEQRARGGQGEVYRLPGRRRPLGAGEAGAGAALPERAGGRLRVHRL